MYKYKPIMWDEVSTVELITKQDSDYKKYHSSKILANTQERNDRYEKWCKEYPTIVQIIRKEYQHFLDIPEDQRGVNWYTENKENYIRYKLEYKTNTLLEIPPPAQKHPDTYRYLGKPNHFDWPHQTRNALINYVLNTETKSINHRNIERKIRKFLHQHADKELPRIAKISLFNKSNPVFKFFDVFVLLQEIYFLLECKTMATECDIEQIKDYSKLVLFSEFYKRDKKPIVSILYSPKYENIEKEHILVSINKKISFQTLNLSKLNQYKYFPEIHFINQIVP